MLLGGESKSCLLARIVGDMAVMAPGAFGGPTSRSVVYSVHVRWVSRRWVRTRRPSPGTQARVPQVTGPSSGHWLPLLVVEMIVRCWDSTAHSKVVHESKLFLWHPLQKASRIKHLILHRYIFPMDAYPSQEDCVWLRFLDSKSKNTLLLASTPSRGWFMDTP